jgi:hypothetical protein
MYVAKKGCYVLISMPAYGPFTVRISAFGDLPLSTFRMSLNT